MKFFIVLACLVAVACAEVSVVRNEAVVNPEDFKYALELDNTIKSEQQGNIKNDAWVVSGQYSFTSPEGEQVSLQYTADENGYHVDASNPILPTSPPVPEAILRGLAYLAAHASKE